MATIKLQKDLVEDGVIYLKAGKDYFVRNEQRSKNPKKKKVVVNSEIKGIELLIEVDR